MLTNTLSRASYVQALSYYMENSKTIMYFCPPQIPNPNHWLPSISLELCAYKDIISRFPAATISTLLVE